MPEKNPQQEIQVGAHNDAMKAVIAKTGQLPGYVVHGGKVWNPLRSFPRNAPCPCGSGAKFKKCHALKLQGQDLVNPDHAKKMQALVDQAKIKVHP